MSKFMLSAGLVLGSLAGISGAGQAVEERGLTEQVKASTLAHHFAAFQVGDFVWVTKDDGREYAGVIVEVGTDSQGRGTIYRVTYDGLGSEYDQWCFPQFLRRR